MVKLEEVPDEEFTTSQVGPKDEEDDWNTDDESDISSVTSDDAVSDESFFDRIVALKDIIPPTYRKNIYSASNTAFDWTSSALSFGGKSLWVVSTSALLLGVPWALAFSEEQQVQEMEREMRMQQGANELLNQNPQQGAKPAL